MGIYYKKKQNLGKSIVLIVILCLLAVLVYLYNSTMFEQEKPSIEISDEIYWNLKDPIKLTLKDNSGIKFAKVSLIDANKSIDIINKTYTDIQKQIELSINYPRAAFLDKKKKISLLVQTNDVSKWNFFLGNQASKKISVNIDTTRPNVYILANSYSITQGGSASVIFRAKDENLDKLYIQTDSKDIFKPVKFYKDGYFISLLAWRHDRENFQANIIAVDKAGNITKERIKYYLLNKKYKTSHLSLNDEFIDGKISILTELYEPEKGSNMQRSEKFQFINETLREKNQKNIRKITSVVPDKQVNDFFLKSFYPLKNAAAVASFGDHRFYAYGKNVISQSYHLGLDLASTKQATIQTSNDGKVVFDQENGIYGNNLIISHGLGVYSLYGHCSSLQVAVGDELKAGEAIAKTGVTGLALGDHLHFGILVQGIEVRPEEWMDKKWFANNITAMINEAKKLINRK